VRRVKGRRGDYLIVAWGEVKSAGGSSACPTELSRARSAVTGTAGGRGGGAQVGDGECVDAGAGEREDEEGWQP
jgi:hypothetical protein